MNGKKSLAIIIPLLLVGFFIHKGFFNKIPGGVKDTVFESVQIFNTAIRLHEKDISVPIDEKFLKSIQSLSSKTDYLRQKYSDSPEIDNCLNYIDLYNNQVLNIFTRVNGTILLTDFYNTEDYDRDSDENFKTLDLMMKVCSVR